MKPGEIFKTLTRAEQEKLFDPRLAPEVTNKIRLIDIFAKRPISSLAVLGVAVWWGNRVYKRIKEMQY